MRYGVQRRVSLNIFISDRGEYEVDLIYTDRIGRIWSILVGSGLGLNIQDNINSSKENFFAVFTDASDILGVSNILGRIRIRVFFFSTVRSGSGFFLLEGQIRIRFFSLEGQIRIRFFFLSKFRSGSVFFSRRSDPDPFFYLSKVRSRSGLFSRRTDPDPVFSRRSNLDPGNTHPDPQP